MAKTQRTDTDLVQSLQRHLTLLEEYHKRAFVDRDENYYGEVAGKLRLLVYRSKTCHPLLADLMNKFGINIKLPLFGPGDQTIDINTYFNQPCGAFRSASTNELIQVTPMGVVRTWAQQIGASHEDPSIDDDFSEYLSHGFYINGRQIAVDELRRASDIVISMAKQFFEKYNPKGK